MLISVPHKEILFQDNKSTILLATNGRWSSSKRTKHIKSRYFFVKDKVEAGEVSIEYRPTDQMWSDVLTKPKQGAALFRKDRAILMNCDVEYDDDKERRDIPSILLPQPEGPVDPATVTITPQSILRGKDRRSVLENKQKTYSTVTWNTSQNKIDRKNPKLRERHLELVIARVMKAKAAKAAAAA